MPRAPGLLLAFLYLLPSLRGVSLHPCLQRLPIPPCAWGQGPLVFFLLQVPPGFRCFLEGPLRPRPALLSLPDKDNKKDNA